MTGAGGDSGAGGPCICPHCGYDLKVDQPITDGRLSFDPRGCIYVDGAKIALPPRVSIVLGTLMKARGRIVSRTVLIERLGSDSDDAWIGVATVIKLLRRALEAAGIRDSIETHYGLGYAWNSAACTPLPAAGSTSGSHLGASSTTSARPFLHSDHRVASKEVV
jgi:DNA-binding winged helix-turn-helix (wHTH) protein